LSNFAKLQHKFGLALSIEAAMSSTYQLI